MRYCRAHDVGFFGGALQLLSRIGVDDRARLVPGELAAIERIDEHAGAILGLVQADIDVVPERAAGGADAVPVQVGGNLACGLAGDIFAEDAAHDLGLLGINLALAGLTRHRAVAIGH